MQDAPPCTGATCVLELLRREGSSILVAHVVTWHGVKYYEARSHQLIRAPGRGRCTPRGGQSTHRAAADEALCGELLVARLCAYAALLDWVELAVSLGEGGGRRANQVGRHAELTDQHQAASLLGKRLLSPHHCLHDEGLVLAD